MRKHADIGEDAFASLRRLDLAYLSVLSDLFHIVFHPHDLLSHKSKGIFGTDRYFV